VFAVSTERKTAPNRRSLIALSDVEHVFDDDAVTELARIAKLPADADVARFTESIRIAARIFLEKKALLNAPHLREAIKRLYQLNTRAGRGGDRAARALAHAADAMPASVRQWLISINARHGRNIPTASEILSPATRQSAIERFRLILSYGGGVVVGRKRRRGRRSRSFMPLLRVPEQIRRGRPSGAAEREFAQWLAVAYLEATEQPPPHTAHHSHVIRGPFPRFVYRCFDLVGAPSGSVTRLINQFGSARRDIACRRLVQPD
jgi:hypothetical protein